MRVDRIAGILIGLLLTVYGQGQGLASLPASALAANPDPVLEEDFQSFTYYSNDSLSLDLDIFMPLQMIEGGNPLVIYVHGGGFSNGTRDAGHKLARHLAEQGIACASISYTLYMEGKSFGCDGILSEKVRAIQIAASQLWLATAYLNKYSGQFNIDTTRIFIAGSSAGAETVLHAAHWDREQMQCFEQALSPGFKYAGIISGAGAIMDLNLITPENKIPTMLFHGDADKLVPYGTAAHHYCPPNSSGWLMLFGSSRPLPGNFRSWVKARSS